MLFNSLGFLAFFTAFVPLYYCLGAPRVRWTLLLAASLFFYATFRLDDLALLFGVSLVAYVPGLIIGRADSGPARQAWLAGAVAALIATLAFAKLVPRAGFAGAVGLSFYTLSAISYLVDVFRRDLAAERHAGRLVVYLAFFPKLLAGPIERAGGFLEQLRLPARFSAEGAVAGLQLMLWGLFKKVVIADRLAPLVDAAYGQPSFAPPADLVLATYFFAFQLYCDFSGYSDMAIGAARVLGFDLMENFRRPYLSASAAEFWSRRWHISLSAWFRDYLYIPLGGSRVSRLRHALNILAVFLASGAWHGASSTFLVWGGLNGLYVAVPAALRKENRSAWAVGAAPRRGARRWLQTVGTFHAVLITWVFFRAASLSDATTILSRVVRALPDLLTLVRVRLMNPEILLSVALIAVLIVVEAVDEGKPMWERLRARPVPVRWAVYYALVFGLIVVGTWNLRQFVYMQF